MTKLTNAQERARRNLAIQVKAEGGTIESCLLNVDLTDIAEEDRELAEIEQLDLIGIWEIDDTPTWNWENRDYRRTEPKIQYFANVYPTGPGQYVSQGFSSKEEAKDSAIDGCYRVAVKMVEA